MPSNKVLKSNAWRRAVARVFLPDATLGAVRGYRRDAT